MANPYRQQSRTRKFVYLGCIFALFTVSLFHRRLVIEPEANFLELREVARGEAELSGAAIRLLLTGSSGLATTFMWSYALDLQEKHQYNRFKIAVASVTKLQPHFSTPWIFQSWNIAFNVSVEFDRPFDKYFYISEGANLLSRGERANQGRSAEGRGSETVGKFHRGNPDMRWFMGFMYQSKLGTSDENITMRCLLDLSCIPPDKRDAKKMLQPDERGGKVVKPEEFANFCREQPRLVRRLRDGLGLTEPLAIVQFLEDNREVPGRFMLDSKKLEFVLRDWKDQFPILPLPFEPGIIGHPGVPNMRDFKLTNETIDPFLMSRTWHEYAQLPLPPPIEEPDLIRKHFDPLRHRLPKRGMVIIFRYYPARAQFHLAEKLQDDGWFDDEGWDIQEWLAEKTLVPESERDKLEILVGVGDPHGPRLDSRRAWKRAHEVFKEYGLKNGLLIPPERERELDALAEVFRHSRLDERVPRDARVERRPEETTGEIAKGFDAHMRLYNSAADKRIVNYDDFLYQAEAEQTPAVARAKKLLYEAERLRKAQEKPALARSNYEEALLGSKENGTPPLWRDVFLRFPKFNAVGPVQEEVYSHQLDYLLYVVQKDRNEFFTELLGQMAQYNGRPQLPIVDLLNLLSREAGGGKIYFRNTRGPLEFVQVYDGNQAEPYRDVLLTLSQGLAAPFSVVSEQQRNYFHQEAILFRTAPRDDLPFGWRFLLTDDNINSVRQRRRLALWE